MPITSVRITDFRNLASVLLEPSHQGLNIICGDNGSGKTSLLEAIHYLGLGRSFRTSSANRLLRHSTSKFSIFAQLLGEGHCYVPVGVERDLSGNTRCRMAERDVSSITDLAYSLPMRVIHSQSHHLFESGPAFRRKYLDWGLFYQSESFLSCWRQFERTLKQRNAVLRQQRAKTELEAWTDELAKHGLALDQLRNDYIKALLPFVSEMAEQLLGVSHLEIKYHSGWSKNVDYAVALANHYQEDSRMGYTQLGPHRADFDITIDTVSVKHFLSRGQQKLLICAMILAQGSLLASYTNKGLIYLVDDLASELDIQSRRKLISLLSGQQAQIFITAIESESVCGLIHESDVPMKVFHVKHGGVVEKA